MARTTIPVRQIITSGVAPASLIPGDPANGHALLYNEGDVILEAQNSGMGTHSVTVLNQRVKDDDLTVTIPRSSTRMIGPLAPDTFNRTDGTVQFEVDHQSVNLRAYAL